MTAETESMILEYLSRMREDRSGMQDDFREIKERVGNLDVQYASTSTRMDLRIERIERRLELSDA
jgi:hypothetical protein